MLASLAVVEREAGSAGLFLPWRRSRHAHLARSDRQGVARPAGEMRRLIKDVLAD